MKSIKTLLLLLFIFSTKVFSQNPIIENTDICVTNNSTATITVTNPILTANYTWQIKTSNGDWTTITSSNAGLLNTGLLFEDFTTSILSIIKKNSLQLSSIIFRVISNNGSGDLISNEAVLTVSSLSVAKTISGASAVCIGGNKQLTYASDSVGTIQWQSSTTSGTLDFEDIDLENKTTYNATEIQGDTWYRVSNTSGSCNTVYSPAVLVSANSLSVSGQIEGGDISVCKTSNSTEMFLYNSEGKIAWQKSSNIEGPYFDINAATTSIYKASALISSTYFRVAVTNGVCPTEFSESVLIDVDPTPLAKIITGASRICTGSSIVLNYGVGSVGEIQWQSSDTGISDSFNDETGESGLNLSLNNLVDTTWFRVMNTSGECSPAFSPVFKITVDELPDEGAISETQTTVCKTSNSTELNTDILVGTIQWQKATDVSGNPGTFTNINLANRQSYTASFLSETTYFRVVISSGVCTPFITKSAKIIVVQPNLAKTISGNSPVCSGGSKVLVYEPGSIGAIQWQFSTTSGTADDFSDVSGEDSETLEAFNLYETTWFRVINTSDFCNPVNSPAVRVLVNPLPESGTINVVENNNTISEFKKSPELSLTNYKGSIQWQKANSLTDDFIDIPNATSSVFQTSEIKDFTYFRAVVSSGDCSKAISEPVKINFNFIFDITLFPNPFENDFNINFYSPSLDLIEYEVYDLLGKRIDRKKITPTEINSTKIGNNYLPGFYTMFIKQGDLKKSVKILKK